MKEGNGVKIWTERRYVLMPFWNKNHKKVQSDHDKAASPSPETWSWSLVLSSEKLGAAQLLELQVILDNVGEETKGMEYLFGQQNPIETNKARRSNL